MQPADGIRIEPLPKSMDASKNEFSLQTSAQIDDLVGRTLISVDCIAEPALFKPGEVANWDAVQTSSLSSVSIGNLCIALALETNKWVEAVTAWRNYGDLRALFMQNGTSSCPSMAPTCCLCLGHCRVAMALTSMRSS